MTAPAEFVASQVIDVIGSKLIKRGIDLTAVKWGDSTPSSGGGVRRCATVVNGIDKETAGKINKDIKAQKLKCKVTIEGDKLRVSLPRHVAGGHRLLARPGLRAAAAVRQLSLGLRT